MNKNLFLGAALAAAMLAGASAPALAQHHDFHGRDYHRFSHHDMDVWRGGRWIHDWHDGRYGWWWFVDGGWYFYPEAVYPYPTYVPPAVVVQQAPPTPQGMPPMQSWYYCDNPQGYYPYVASCNMAWREVPASPPPGVAPSAPPGPPPGAPPGAPPPPP